jgi:hypothetical protein
VKLQLVLKLIPINWNCRAISKNSDIWFFARLARAQIQFQATRNTEQYVKVGSMWFYAPINVEKATGKVIGVRTVFPRIPAGVQQ